MRVFAHPFRVAADGSAATVEQWTDAQAALIAQIVAHTIVGERPLAPDFGIPDPAGRGVDAATLQGAVELCEPDLMVTAVDAPAAVAGSQTVRLAVQWRPDEED